MFIDQNKRKRDLYTDNVNVGKKLNDAFYTIQEEFDDHLSAINDNTNEIQANFEFISRIDTKIDKMNERLDQIQMAIQKLTGVKIETSHPYKPISLSKEEQLVFLILYTQDEVQGCITYPAIAQRIKVSEELAKGYVTNMIEKGVPIVKRYINKKAYLSIDPEFKEIQAKENILGIAQQQIKA
jgi:predicted transcriptional regulator